MKWLVIYVASRQEKKVEIDLNIAGIECYLPLAKKLSQWSDRKKWVEFPMFNGYVFIRPNKFQMDAVLQIRGVVNYLRFERKPAVVRDEEIEIIKKIAISGYHVENVYNPEDYEIGEILKVTEGPLKGQEVELVRKNDEKTFLVSFESINQSIKIQLPAEVLEKPKGVM